MPRDRTRRRASRRLPRASRRSPNAAASGARAQRRRFVGRDPSPVLDRYPPKDAPSFPAPPPPAAPPAPSLSGTSPAAPAPSPPPPAPLIRLEAPFDVDAFSEQLGENTIEVKVPREDLAEVLRRITDFMGFGVYVYRFTVRPEPAEQLRRFVVRLERVDYAPAAGDWTPFQEKGRSESPFGPDRER
ncbi:MAG: hypothetical protein QXG65_01120 [Thermoplasmata archaeon]